MCKPKERIYPITKPILVAACAVAVPALAQERSVVLEEIVVTAEHREASLQETRISLAAFSEAAIAELGISNGLDIGEYVPNLNAQEYVGGRAGVSFNIRGVGNAETLVTFDPAVSVYVDGVLIPKNTGALMDALELERIEVLRGPQGTLYGRNTMGGAVNYVTKKPTDVLEGRISTTVGKFNQRDLRGMLNVPILGADSAVGELNARVSLASIQRDGTQKNMLPNAVDKELGTKDREVATIQLLWRPIDNLTVNYSYDYMDVDEVPETSWTTGINPNSSAGPLLAPYAETRESRRPSRIMADAENVNDTEVQGHGLTVTWDLSENMSLYSISGFRKMENLGIAENDGSPLPVLRSRDLQEFESWSQEFRLIGNTMNDRLSYALGLFYFEEEGDVFNETRVFGGVQNMVNIAEFSGEAWAAYGQVTYAFTDRLDLTVGVRYTDEDREMKKLQTLGALWDDRIPFYRDVAHLYAGNTCSTTPTGSLNCNNTVFPRARLGLDNVSGMISLGYNWTDDIMTYAKVSQGFQSGGFNSRDSTWADFTRGFDEETIIAYELGLKSLFDGRYLFNMAWFFSDYDDKRVNQFNPETLASVQRNAGVVEIWGVEMELLAQLTDNWQVGVNYGHMNQKYVEYEAPSSTDPTQIVDLSKMSNFPYAPRNSASAHVAYERPMERAVFRARLDWTYRDHMTFLVPKPELNSSGSVQLWNARVTLDEIDGPGDSTLRISAWGKNLLNEGYWNMGVNIYSSFGYNINRWGEPRTYGVDFELKF